jgi:hypothetical protein
MFTSTPSLSIFSLSLSLSLSPIGRQKSELIEKELSFVLSSDVQATSVLKSEPPFLFLIYLSLSI